ncbi:uncharacterized protein LOC110757435 [Prunus avium]|uniref:Uncharacterized protein LOC110757435 n=1 Tax=Prunus avium TaxID=42229 RepID=A0A6P5SLS2_PRUAV|nr:uncharacterized protein LOC110757435 [Prunus avium]
MNTKTMRLPPRRISTTNASNNNKRKEKESGFDALHQSTTTTKMLKLAPPPQAGSNRSPEPASSGQLLAGYLAHEFLTKGTLLGQPWDTSKAEPAPASPDEEAEPRSGSEPHFENLERYVEVADLLKTDGAHLAGIVNPTQLARVLQL